MALQSMTGFGRKAVSSAAAAVVVEMRSVNHRQFDLRLDLPQELSGVEAEARQTIRAALARGAVSCRVIVAPSRQSAAGAVILNRALLRDCLAAARGAARALGVEDDLKLSALLSIPGALAVIQPVTETQKLQAQASVALRGALAALKAMRAREGRALEIDLRRRLARLEMIAGRIAFRSPRAIRQHRARLEKLLASAAPGGMPDRKLVREVVSALERGDIAEELQRIRSHLGQFRGLLDGNRPAGREMDFIAQELSREINTIGAKANDCAIARLVVEYKSELECVREQAQNVE